MVKEIDPIDLIDRLFDIGGLRVFRIYNIEKQKWWEGTAHTHQEACKKLHWQIGDCWIRAKTKKHSWCEIIPLRKSRRR